MGVWWTYFFSPSYIAWNHGEENQNLWLQSLIHRVKTKIKNGLGVVLVTFLTFCLLFVYSFSIDTILALLLNIGWGQIRIISASFLLGNAICHLRKLSTQSSQLFPWFSFDNLCHIHISFDKHCTYSFWKEMVAKKTVFLEFLNFLFPICVHTLHCRPTWAD